MNLRHQVRRLFCLAWFACATLEYILCLCVAPSLSCFLLIDVGPDFGDNQACSQGDLPTCLLSLFACDGTPFLNGQGIPCSEAQDATSKRDGGQGSQTWKHLQLSSLGHHSPHYDERRRMARKYVLYIAHSAARVTMTRQSV